MSSSWLLYLTCFFVLLLLSLIFRPDAEASDPMLMTGFDHKVLHLSRDGTTPEHANVRFAIELDTLGTALYTGRWRRIAVVTLTGEAGNWYEPYVFATGMTAHWARVVALDACDSCTATFMYT